MFTFFCTPVVRIPGSIILDLSFLGWYILSAIPFVSVYTNPYTNLTKVNYYRAISGRWDAPVHVDYSV